MLWFTFPLQKVLAYLQPLLRNPRRKLPNSSKLRGCWGYYAVQGHPRSPSLVPIKSSCDFLLVINTNLRLILHRFRDSAFNRSKIATFGYLSFVYGNSPSEGLPWDDLRKMAYQIVPNCVETLPKISIAWVVCTNVTDRQQTTDRWQADGRWHIAIANNDW